MRVIDCACGTTIKAANDAELERWVREHIQEAHSGDELSDDEVKDLIARRAYDATDA